MKQVPGLYIIGEALDVTGWLGGLTSSGLVLGGLLRRALIRAAASSIAKVVEVSGSLRIRQQQVKLVGLKQPFTIVFLQRRLFENERKPYLPKINH